MILELFMFVIPGSDNDKPSEALLYEIAFSSLSFSLRPTLSLVPVESDSLQLTKSS